MSLWIFLSALLSTAPCVFAGNVQVMMSIIPSGSIVKYINEDLNLTCRVNSNAALRYRVTWNFPIKKNVDRSRIGTFRQPNEVTVTIYQLQESDSGQYYCEVSGNDIHYRQNLWVTVKSNNPERQKCSEHTFQCGSGPCIARRYVCDGYTDCPDALDEAPAVCGFEDACKGKLRCDDGRCISPSLCCNAATDSNCASLYLVDCCHKLVPQPADPSVHPQYGDIGFIQSTIYTIVSCAVAFVFITLIMIVAICRIHMKRSVMSLHPHASRPRSCWPWECLRRRSQPDRRNRRSRVEAEETASDESLYRSSWTYPCSVSSTGSFVVTYNGVDGVRLVERLPKPPPYSEAPSSGGVGPPPPYSSVEDVRPQCDSSVPLNCPTYGGARR